MAAFSALVVVLGGCGGGRTSGDVADGASAAGTDELSRSLAMRASTGALPARPEVIALAQSIEAHAVKEGAGARAVELHVAAASLLERVWRTEHREQDAREAIDLLHAASRDLDSPGACDAAIRGARLSGELAHDASTTYTELYRAWRRAEVRESADAGRDCARAADEALATIAAFRPAAPVLLAIDQGLVGEGAILAAPSDASSRTAAQPKIVRIDQWAGEEAARVVIQLDRPARYRAGDEASGNGRGARTFVELDGVDVGQVTRDTALGGIASRVRAEATSTGARVTLDLSGRAYRKVFHLPEPYRVVIDIARHPPGESPRGQRNVARVVIDPGHGGTDPGAIGPGGAKEKDVTLDIAHRVAPVLAKNGLQVILTRDDDRFITLEERTARANGFGADLFVSIHCNAAENHSRHGVETYVLDTTTSDIAARVAARENATSQAATQEIGSILANMRLADQASRSTKLAELLQRASLASLQLKYPDVLDGGVHTAGFYVLVGARMPGVLLETSYISNPTEEERLTSDDYKQRLSDAIVNAIKAYREGR